MKHKDFSTPSMMIQNLLKGSDDLQNFEHFQLKKVQKKKVVNPFADLTNTKTSSKRKSGKKSRRLDPLQSSMKSHTISIGLQLQKNQQQNSQKQDSNDEFEKELQNIYFDCAKQQKSDVDKQKGLDLRLKNNNEEEKSKSNNTNHNQEEKLQDSILNNNNYDQLQSRKIQKDIIEEDCNNLFQTKKLVNVCLKLQDQSQSQSQNQQSKKQEETINFQIKNRTAIFKTNQSYEEVNDYTKNNQNLAFQEMKQAINTQKNKKQLLLTNFEDEDQQKSNNLNAQKEPMDTVQNSEIQRKNNIFLNDFGESSDDQKQQQVTGQTNIKRLSSGSDILIRSIGFAQFLRIASQSYAYEAVPQNCIFQTILKRYPQCPNSIVYEMFDSSTYKSILKVKKCSEGLEIFSSKQSPFGCGIFKNVKGNEQTSCALIDTNFFSTQFNCFKFNRNNQKPDISKLQRHITIQYESNLFGLKGPRKMQLYIPGLNYVVKGQKNLREIYNLQRESKNVFPIRIQKFINKTPRWNNQISSFVLNFNGRATVSSVKNFIITRQLEANMNVVAQQSKYFYDTLNNHVLFGKIEKNVFNLDIKHPFNLIQALTIALSSFDKKIGCQ